MQFLRSIDNRVQSLRLVILMLLIFTAGFTFGNLAQPISAQNRLSLSAEDEQLLEPLWQVFNLIQTQYVDPEGDEIIPSKLIDAAIAGMVDSLGDQFSGYMDPETYPLLNDDLSGSIEGIGVVIRLNEELGGIEVVNVMSGTPAEQAGVRVGDIFMVVDGVDVTADSQLELASKVRGPAGSIVEITFRRGEQLIDMSIRRERIEIVNIDYYVIENTDIGYIKLNQFTSNARDELRQAIDALDTNTRSGLIVDFRGNPGGLLSSAIDVASLFIKEGVVLIEDFGDGREQIFNANGRSVDIQVPIVLLVDRSSASASELVAGALQDNELATIIGEVTLGKGTVQTWRDLPNGGGIRLTIARWLTPDRNWIHGAGITPDILVEWPMEDAAMNSDDDPQLAAAINFLLTRVPTVSMDGN